MDLKQTFSNLQAWAKKNPKTAGALALGVIVLAVIVARRAASSGGGGSASESTPAQIDGGQLDLSGLGTSGASMPAMSGALDLGAGGGSGSAGGGGESFQPSAPALVASDADFSGGGFSGDSGAYDMTPAPSYASAAAPVSTGDMLGLKTITATAGAGVKGAAAKIQPAKTITATAGAGVKGAAEKIQPVKTTTNTPAPALLSLGSNLLPGANKSPAQTPAKNLVAVASAKIAPTKTTTAAKKTPTPAPVLFAWYKTPWAARVWLPVTVAQARGYIKVV